MRVRDIDSNGLIHILNQEAAEEENVDKYHKAVLNILNAQKFSCIPLVDNPRIRGNTNNLVDRAVYESGQGVVTHIARKGIYDDESELVIVDVNDIPLVNDDGDVMIGIEKFFSRENDVDRCHFCLLVGKSKREPTALLTIYELKSNVIRDEIIKRLAIECYEQNDWPLLELGVQLEKNIGSLANKNDLDINKIQTQVSTISDLISRVPIEKNPQQVMRHTNLYKHNEYSDVKIKDVMTVVSAGIFWDKNEPSSELAAKILSLGNDFSNLITYDETGILKSIILSVKSGKRKIKINEKVAQYVNVNNPIKDVYSKFQTSSNDNFLIIPANENLIFGEGIMKWPGLITDDNLKSRLALLHVGTMCVNIEVLFTRVAKKFGITNTFIKRGESGYMKPIDECSLGQVLTELRRKKILSRIPKLKEEDVKPTEDLRNKIFHIALSTIPMKERKRKLSISQVCSANRVLIALEQHFTK